MCWRQQQDFKFGHSTSLFRRRREMCKKKKQQQQQQTNARAGGVARAETIVLYSLTMQISDVLAVPIVIP